ncbi:MAG TPA: methyltransferase domain-containing protein [Solirubrobacterales bacterium]|nr:methyltransferase domain-containing protein [Solirubrobacterales bacterium]
MESERRPTPPRIRIAGRALNATIARAPWLWPVLKRPVRAFFERAAPGWDQRTGAGGVEHLAALATAVIHVAPEPERVLDLGTGTGEAALFCAREFPHARVRGVDISEEMVRSAQAKIGLDPDGRVAFRVDDAAKLSYDDDSFDLVVGVNMPPFFGEIARVLRPGGHAIVVASWGEATPFYTPDAVLDRGFRRHGIEPRAAGRAEGGTYWVGRKLPG